jgi:uncharacterized membrane protein
MTASKSSRARNARSGAQASAGAAGRNGAAVKAGTAAKAGSATRNGTAARNGNAGRNGATGTGGAGTSQVRTGPRGSGAAGRGGSRRPARQDDFPAKTAEPGPAFWMQAATFALALAGLGVSIYLTIAHFTESTLAGCSETKGLVNCTKVTTSAQSYVFGIPVAVLGLAFYVFAVAIMSPWAWRAARREIHLLRIASLVAGIGFVLYLLYAELFIIGSICLYCTSVHVITFVLFVLTMLAAAIWGLKPGAAWPQRLRLGRRAG